MITRAQWRIRVVLGALGWVLGLGAAVLAAGWSVPFGSGSGQAGFDNGKVNPTFQEASALGPLAFRLQDGELWLADSLNGRLLRFGPDGKCRQTLPIAGVATNTLLEDLAFELGPKGPESCWVADAADGVVRKLRLADGQELARIGGLGEGPGRFIQISQVETGPAGVVGIADVGRQIVAVYSPEGKLLHEIPSSRSGFAFDRTGSLSLLEYSEGVGYRWLTFGPDGRLRHSRQIGQAEFQNPRIWGVLDSGHLVVSFVPPGGFRGQLQLMEFGAAGGVQRRAVFRPPQAMNRFLDRDGRGGWWLAAGDFAQAPAGRFSVQPLQEEKAER